MNVLIGWGVQDTATVKARPLVSSTLVRIHARSHRTESEKHDDRDRHANWVRGLVTELVSRRYKVWFDDNGDIGGTRSIGSGKQKSGQIPSQRPVGKCQTATRLELESGQRS